MSLYLALDLLIVSFPLLFGDLAPVRYRKRYKAVFLSILAVGIPFVLWDIIFTKIGVWSFNPAYISGFKLAGLPLEEALFFVAVPFSCLFILECLEVFIGDKVININRRWIYAVVAALLLFALAFPSRLYTVLVVELTAAFILAAERFFPDILRSRNYWGYLIICFGLFLVFNSILTALPVVSYSSLHISNIRFFTIPAEDFIYNYLLLSACAAVYIGAKKL
ncbi:MAG: lycopene cyclase domain-containing protein [Candidatus Margulisiibacteriota bacterium]